MTKAERCLLYILSLTCMGLFLYNTLACIITYSKFETVSKNSLQDQQVFPLPSICVDSRDWVNSQLEKNGLTKKQYKSGKWKIPNMTEEELYDIASPRFKDLVTEIKLQESLPNTDDYKETEIQANISEFEMKNNGITLTRADYHNKLKVYCMEFSYKYGLQKVQIVVNNKVNVKISIIPPKSHTKYERRRNEILIIPDYTYTYQINQMVLISLPLPSQPCSHDMDFMEDICWNNHVNR